MAIRSDEMQKWIDAVTAAMTSAIEAINTGGEVFFDDPQMFNRNELRKLALRLDPTKANWCDTLFWGSVLIAAREAQVLKARPTRLEIEKEREARDRAAGRQVKIRNEDRKHQSASSDAKVIMDKWKTDLEHYYKPTKSTASVDLAPFIHTKFQDYTPDQLKAFKKLSGEQIRFIRVKQQSIHPEFFDTSKGYAI